MTTTTAMPDPSAIYHGVYRSGTCHVLIEIPGRPDEGTELTHVVRHSPTGIGWGYAGSGPADCARSILIDALGADAVCPSCDGTQRVVFSPEPAGDSEYERAWQPATDGPLEDMDPARWGTCRCDDGYRPLPYQTFKFEVIGCLDEAPAEWRISRGAVQGWYRRHIAVRDGRLDLMTVVRDQIGRAVDNALLSKTASPGMANRCTEEVMDAADAYAKTVSGGYDALTAMLMT